MMTLDELRAMNLPEESTEQLWTALEEAAHRAEKAEGELTRLHLEEKSRLLNAALTEAGLHPDAARLLAEKVDAESLHVESGVLKNSRATVETLKLTYPGLFPEAKPVARIAPPTGQTPRLTRDALAAMSAEDINRSWAYVKEALKDNA
ncbi:MAG: hypothetical protein Q4C54_03905 [Clostridia bacterium]|nr:hypothetical protein [Clostridia bacterium]